MRNLNRILSVVLDSRTRTTTVTTAGTTLVAGGALPYAAAGHLASAPWEGLYLELED